MNIINNLKVHEVLQQNVLRDKTHLDEIIKKALEGRGLDVEDVAALLGVRQEEELNKIYRAANAIKREIYGDRIVLFAPLYLSNHCSNQCLYCGFSAHNTKLKRKTLSLSEVLDEAEALVHRGHKRLLLVCGEDQQHVSPKYVSDMMGGIYDKQDIRRLNVNMAPLDKEGFSILKQAGIGTYQLFQETYHRETYGNMHPSGKKRDYDWRISGYNRAFEAGIDDLGFGVLFGLYDFRFEVLALLEHINFFEKEYGVGPHTISVPRWRPAEGARMTKAPFEVDDKTFMLIVSVLRLAVPYTGIILSTRETPQLRKQLIHLGVSQISAGSSTTPGGYKGNDPDSGQFHVDDHRTVEEVVTDICSDGFLPSFCTACYRKNRTGADFMALAKTGSIKDLCQANAVLTFQEYLLDYAMGDTCNVGEKSLEKEIEKIPSPIIKDKVRERINQLKFGARDLYF